MTEERDISGLTTGGLRNGHKYEEPYMNTQQSFLAVMEELMQFPRCCQCLCPSINQLQQVGPRLVDAVLPFSNCRCIRMASSNQLIADVIDGGNTLLANHLCFVCKLLESVTQHLKQSSQQRDIKQQHTLAQTWHLFHQPILTWVTHRLYKIKHFNDIFYMTMSLLIKHKITNSLNISAVSKYQLN